MLKIEKAFQFIVCICDEETRLYYLNNRYYNEIICRFINADVFGGYYRDIFCSKLFVYCHNNPTNHIDANGFVSQNPFPWTSTPYDFRTGYNSDGELYWRWYDGKGRSYVDRHFTDHNLPNKHSNYHDQKYIYDDNGNRIKTEHYNYRDKNGKLINKDDNQNNKWPGQDEWDKEKEEYEESQNNTNSNETTKDVIVTSLILAAAWYLGKVLVTIAVPGGGVVWAIP